MSNHCECCGRSEFQTEFGDYLTSIYEGRDRIAKEICIDCEKHYYKVHPWIRKKDWSGKP